MATFEQAIHQTAVDMGVHKSNNEAINFMTVPQLKAAQKILNEKISKGDVDPTIKGKLERLNAQYSKTIVKINSVYDRAAINENFKAVVTGKRDMITLAKMDTLEAQRDAIDKKNLFNYGKMDATADFFRELNKSIPLAKVGLGVGIGLAGLGAISLIPGSMPAIGAFLVANPAFTPLVASGAALALAVKLVPAIYKAAKKVQANRAAMENVKADAYESAYETQEKARQEKEAKEKAEKEAKEKEEKEKADKEKAEKEAKEQKLSEQAFKSVTDALSEFDYLTQKQADAKFAEIQRKFPNLTENQLSQIQILLNGKTLNKPKESTKKETKKEEVSPENQALLDENDKLKSTVDDLHSEIDELKEMVEQLKNSKQSKTEVVEEEQNKNPHTATPQAQSDNTTKFSQEELEQLETLKQQYKGAKLKTKWSDLDKDEQKRIKSIPGGEEIVKRILLNKHTMTGRNKNQVKWDTGLDQIMGLQQ